MTGNSIKSSMCFMCQLANNDFVLRQDMEKKTHEGREIQMKRYRKVSERKLSMKKKDFSIYPL